MKKRVLFMVGLLFGITTVISQNLLNTTSWTVSSGSVYDYNQYGTTPENSRVLGENHIGSEVLMWQASPDSGGGQSGGFGTSYKNIDNTKDYRLSVWIKKTNSNDGHTYFKCTSYIGGVNHLLKLNGGDPTDYPRFWKGDLPHLDRWYLLVGFVHKSSYSSTTNLGKIYDGVTGEEVQTITDFKFKSTATKLNHRAFLYADTNLQDRQYMYAPTMYEVDGLEPTIDQLLSVNEDSILTFTYDTAGNQTVRFYCLMGGCRYSSKSPEEKNSLAEDVIEESKNNESVTLQGQLSIFPNPAKDIVTIQVTSELLSQIESIQVYNSNSSLLQNLQFKDSNSQEIDLTGKPTGVYFLHLHLTNGKSITKKIIKL